MRTQSLLDRIISERAIWKLKLHFCVFQYWDCGVNDMMGNILVEIRSCTRAGMVPPLNIISEGLGMAGDSRFAEFRSMLSVED